MKVGILFSGGKDSAYAMHKVRGEHTVVCLITIASKNPESYMFHTPNIDVTCLQAEASGLPLVRVESEGVKEDELKDLEKAVLEAKSRYGIEGVVTGAIESVYQSERVQRICDRLGLRCFNPLWKKDQVTLLSEILGEGFKVIISGVFAYPLDETWLGKELDAKTTTELVKLTEKFQISPSGEGGEIETTVLDAPFFKKRVVIIEAEKTFRQGSGTYAIRKAELVGK